MYMGMYVCRRLSFPCRPSCCGSSSRHGPRLQRVLGHLDMTRSDMPEALNKGTAEFWNEAEAKENLRRTGNSVKRCYRARLRDLSAQDGGLGGVGV